MGRYRLFLRSLRQGHGARWLKFLTSFPRRESTATKYRIPPTAVHPADLPCLGSKSRVSEILNGQRQPTVDQIRALHQHLGIPVASLIGSFKHEPAAGPSSTSIAAEGKLRRFGVMKAKENLAGFLTRSKAS